MQASVQYIPGLLSGELIRYGTILKSATSGQIVGHLKEVGSFSSMVGGMPMSPLSAVMGGVNTLSSLTANLQLRQVQKAVESLKLITEVGAAASVASLGVSVIGFAAVMHRLGKMDGKLDSLASQVSSISMALSEQGLKWDFFTMAALDRAAGYIDKAILAGPERRRELLRVAVDDFSERKAYFHQLIRASGPLLQSDIQIHQATELLSRYETAALGEVHAEFLLGDFGACRATIDATQIQMREILSPSAKDMFRARTGHATGNSLALDLPALRDACKSAVINNVELMARTETAITEIDFVERSGLDPFEYINQLKTREVDIVLIEAPSLTSA